MIFIYLILHETLTRLAAACSRHSRTVHPTVRFSFDCWDPLRMKPQGGALQSAAAIHHRNSTFLVDANDGGSVARGTESSCPARMGRTTERYPEIPCS